MRIFVSGPYGDHNPPEVIARNVAEADRIARELVWMGHEVYCPHTMQHGWERDRRLSYEDFMRVDKSFMQCWAQATYRLPGESEGSELEEAWARYLGLPVFYRLSQVPPVPTWTQEELDRADAGADKTRALLHGEE